MKEKDLIELGFQSVYYLNEGPYYEYNLSEICFMTIRLKTGDWGVWLNDACDTIITDLEDLKTVMRIMKKYAGNEKECLGLQ